MSDATESRPVRNLAGALHLFVAFDWGDEIDLNEARRIVPSERHVLPRKSRTPSSIAYEPTPLRSKLDSVRLELAELGTVAADADVTIFDFGAVSAAVHVPFQADSQQLTTLAGRLSEPEPLIAAVRTAVEPLFERLKPAIENPVWSDIQEEYFVFQVLPSSSGLSVSSLPETEEAWLAGLVRLEAEPLSASEVAEALRFRLSYSPNDLFIPDWAAAVIFDDDCDEVLDAIAFANLQLLEYRHIDNRLDAHLQQTYGLIRQLARTWLPFWRSHGRTVRAMGELKVESNIMLERTSNVLKLVGEPYLARAYQLLATRFHLDEWGLNIRRSISVLEGTYQVISDQAAAYRMEALEVAIVVLILFEIAMAFAK